MSVAVGRKTANVGNANVTVISGKSVIVGIAILKAAAGGILKLTDGGISGTLKITVQADDGGVFIPMNVPFNIDIFAAFTGTSARFLIILD